MPGPSAPPPALTVAPLASLAPPSSTRSWQTVPHPRLPIVASASSDKTVRVYSLTSFTLLSTITGGHKRSIRALAWKPNTRGESVLATGSFDASAGIWRRWEVEGDGIRARAGEGEGGDEDDAAEELDFTGAGKRGDEDDDEEWRFSIVLEGHESEVKCVAFNAGGQYLATCSRDKSVWIWEEIEEDEWETVAVLQEHDGDVKCVVWHPQEDLLASASYDDTVRLYREDLDDWSCVAVLRGHSSTVWSLVFEPTRNLDRLEKSAVKEEQKVEIRDRRKAGPRLLSCSDDQTIRVWRRRPRQPTEQPTGSGSFPSILRGTSIEEDWYEECRLPQHHNRAIYSLDWSKQSGRVVSTGSDGKLVIYEERWRPSPSPTDETMASPAPPTEWVVVGELEAAHDVFEINHVCFTSRRDRARKGGDGEEILISTGDDGEVKLWTLEST